MARIFGNGMVEMKFDRDAVEYMVRCYLAQTTNASGNEIRVSGVIPESETSDWIFSCIVETPEPQKPPKEGK